MRGIFGDLFDLNGDGEIDAVERAFEFMVLDEIMREEEVGDDEE